jgi:hypothetical protein
MTSVAALFAEVTGKLEDLHAIAIEGQASDELTDMRWALLGFMGVGLSDLEMAVQAIREALNDA